MMSGLWGLIRDKTWLFLIVLGTVFILLSFYSVSGPVQSLSITHLGEPSLYLFVTGAALGVLSGVYSIAQIVANRPSKKSFLQSSYDSVEVLNGRICAKFRTSKIFVHFGCLQNVVQTNAKSAVVLSINDLFEDGCFDDKTITLGSYLAHHFDHAQISELKAKKAQLLALPQADRPQTEAGASAAKFEIGRCIQLEKLGHRMLVVAVSNRKPDQGVKTEISYIYQAMQSVLKEIANRDINTLYIPLLGAGKGGVPSRVALMSLLNAICERISQSDGHHFAEVNIVIFQRDGSSPQIDVHETKEIASVVLKLWAL